MTFRVIVKFVHRLNLISGAKVGPCYRKKQWLLRFLSNAAFGYNDRAVLGENEEYPGVAINNPIPECW